MAKILVNNSGPLHGEVWISGAKNAVLPLLAATILTEDSCVIEGVPDLADVTVMKQMLENYGAHIDDSEEGVIKIKTPEVISCEGDRELVQEMRASLFTMGPMLARYGKVVMPMPGGCTIGKRPIDLHLKGFRALGAEVDIDEENEVVTVTAGKDGLVGDAIYLDFPSVGATENILMAATLSKGTTIIENAAKEPEIIDVATLLNNMGANVKGAGTNVITIEGVSTLHGCAHEIIPDRIEAGTFLIMAAACAEEMKINNVIPKHIEALTSKLQEMGVKLEIGVDSITVYESDEIHGVDVTTKPYPGFATDLQQPLTALMTRATGESHVVDTIYSERFKNCQELQRMGAKIEIGQGSCTIDGPTQLYGDKVVATDLRCGACLVIAGLMAEGITEIRDVHHIDRGYDDIDGKLKRLGARIYREMID